MYANVKVSRYLKEELDWAIDKRLRLIINKMLFKTVSYTTKNLKNKVVFNLKRYCMRCYVTLSKRILINAYKYVYIVSD